jgi:hypothetical protein
MNLVAAHSNALVPLIPVPKIYCTLPFYVHVGNKGTRRMNHVQADAIYIMCTNVIQSECYYRVLSN